MRTYFQKLGFDDHEIAVYLACLQSKRNTPTSLSRQTGMKRSTLYFYLDKLKQKGVVGYTIQNKRKFVTALPVQDALETLVEKQKEKIVLQEESIHKLLPQLQKIVEQRSNTTNINYYEGKEGGRILINSIIESKSDLYWMGSIETILKVFDEAEFYKLMTLRRMKHTTTSYAITDRSILAKKRFSETIGNFRQLKFLDEKITTPSVICVFGNTIGIVSVHGHEVKTVVVQDGTMSEIVLLLFRVLWSQLKQDKEV